MKKRFHIGVIISDCPNESVSAVLQGLIAQAFLCKCSLSVLTSVHGYNSILREQFPCEADILSLIESDCFDCYIYDRNYYKYTGLYKRIDDLLIKTGKPVMLLDGGEHDFFENTVAHDFEAFEELTEHMITVHGCRKIYCFTGPKGNIQAEERLQGYMTAMKRHHLPCDESCYQYGDFWKNKPVIFAKQLLSREIPMPDAVMCGNDIMADALISALKSGGIRVPEDVAVTGYDGTSIRERSEAMLTTYQKSNFLLGTEAVRRLYAILTGKRCRRIHNDAYGIMLGHTCGCMEIPCESGKAKRHRKIQKISAQKLKHSNMLIDLLSADSLWKLMMNLSGYVYLNYGWKRFRLFLSENYLDTLNGSQEKHSVDSDTMMKEVIWCEHVGTSALNNEMLRAADIPQRLSTDHDFPAAYYLVPLTHHDCCFGIAAISFGKKPMAFGGSYTYFITYITAALEQLRIKCSLQSAADKSGQNNPLYFSLAALRTDMQKKPEMQRSIDTLCKQIHVSRSYLQKMYKQFFGCSIFDDIIRFRMDKAKELLVKTELTVTETAVQCGYSTYSHFVRQFRNSENMTPTEYRKMHKK